MLLASLADWRADVCRKAALELGDLTDATVVRLLLDAAQECAARVSNVSTSLPSRRRVGPPIGVYANRNIFLPLGSNRLQAACPDTRDGAIVA